MVQKLANLIYKILALFDFIFFKITKRSYMNFVYDIIRKNSYTNIVINNQKIGFFTPSEISKWRVNTLYTKEPETLEWIDNFQNSGEKIIFWDIGANIGLYSIYAAVKFKNINVIAFEASTSNLAILSRNISLNNLSERIILNQFPLTNKENKYLTMSEKNFEEGGAWNSFGEKFDADGNNFQGENNYKVYGTTINYLIKNNILEIPNYIKIDVDGIEHMILDGGKEYLKNSKVKSISVEINENFKEQYDQIQKILLESNFVFKYKKNSEMVKKSNSSKIYNFVFEKKINF